MTKKERWIVFPSVAVLLLAATFFDLRISLAVYGKNLFSTIFEVVGEAPIQFLALFGALVLLRFRSKKTKLVSVVLAGAYGLLAAAFAFMLGFATINYVNENIAHELPVFVSLATALAGLTFAIWLARSVPKERAKEAVTFAIIAIVYVLLIVIVMNSIKGIWGRLRMREMLDPASEFTPWYQIHSRGGFDNRYASFPSGHTMNAAGLILLTLLPGIFTKLKGRETLLRIVAYAWAVVVGFSRVVAGAHFTTDVLFGILLSYALFEGTRAIVTKIQNRNRSLETGASAKKRGKGMKKEIIAEVKAERARRKARRAEIRALPQAKRAAAKSADRVAKKEAKKARKLAIRSMAKDEKRTAKRHDKRFKRVWKRPRRLIIWAAALCLLVFGIVSVAPYIGDYTSLSAMKIDSNTPAGDLARENGAAVSQEIADEGIVLLKNADGMLPLTGGKVNVFSYAAYNIRYGGSGSGGADASSAVDLFAGLTNAGIAYNEMLDAFYRAQEDISQKGSSNGLISVIESMTSKKTDEPAIDYLTEDVMAQAKEYSDTAIIVIGSDGVEASDFKLAALGLTKNRIDLFDKVCASFDNVIVIVNAGNAMELGFLDQYPSIKAALWIGTPGPLGCNSLGKILAGEINPSGRLVDTYAYDAGSCPASVNFGDYKYDNIKGMSFINYNEGIYIGYRYYESRFLGDEDGYKAAVQFPFGYGLSYTNFDWKTTNFTQDDKTVSIDVQVTNTGSVAGKDVVEVYFSAPYTPGGMEKSAIELAGYAKTNLLAPGESQTVTVSFPLRDMSSYDMNDKQAYVLDAGEYAVKVGRSVHDIVDTKTFAVAKTVVYKTDEVTGTELNNLFSYADGGLQYLSRNDWAGTYPNNDTLSYTASQAVLDGAAAQKPAVDTSALPATGADNGILLKDMKGLDYNDEKWQAFLDQFTIDELKEVFVNAAYRTVAVERLGVPQIILLDAPAGINSLFSKVTAMSYPTEVVLASTWNNELVYRMGEAVGTEANAYGVTGWYAPGMNLHRTPQGGRNFEYFSEDPLLSGKIAANMVGGAESKHLLVTMKHFVLNDQETNARSGIYAWANEQAIRELYLRPFEITVKEGHVNGAMSSFIHVGYKWSGGNPELLNQVLRNEWGFTGFVTTDAVLGKFMDANLALHNGNDLMLAVMPTNNRNYLTELYAEDPVGVTKGLRERMHNFCYALVNDTNLF